MKVTPEESKWLHTDWWGQCRTCKHWSGQRGRRLHLVGEEIYRDRVGTCYSNDSPFYLRHVRRNGYCSEWDSFDLDVAIEVMEEGAA